MNILDLPFNQHLRLRLTEHDGQETVCLDPGDHHRNHLGTVHAGAIYSLAEAASGHALLTRIDLDSNETMAVLRSAKIKYRRPANQQLLALASFDDSAAASLMRNLQAKGRAFIDVHVQVLAGNEEVATGDYTWFVSSAKT